MRFGYGPSASVERTSVAPSGRCVNVAVSEPPSGSGR